MSSKISSRIHGRSAGPSLIHNLSRELAALADTTSTLGIESEFSH